MAAKPFASGHILAAADVNDLVGVLERNTTAIDVVSSAGVSVIAALTAPAGAMSTDRMIRATIIGDYLNNTGSNATLLWSIRFGPVPTIMWEDGPSASIGTSATRRRFQMQFVIANIASASVQQLSGSWFLTLAQAGSGGGIGDVDTGFINTGFGGTAAVNTAIAQPLNICVQHNTSSASLSIRKTYSMLELL